MDAEAIGQILGNLVDNAAKYSGATASPTIHLGAAAENGSLVLTVRDHGPGLGLALARGLARDTGGKLTLESPSDGGARFRLELPARASAT